MSELNMDSLPPWGGKMLSEAWEEAQRRASRERFKYSRYRDSPVSFGRDVLGYDYTPDIQQMMRSVVLNPVTLARSANGTGKTHSAASIAIWFYMTYPDAQVYVTSAPPVETNLKNLLWGEILRIVHKNPELFIGEKIIELQIERAPRVFIQGVTIPTTGTKEEREAKFSGKHAPHLLFIVDEGDAVPEEVYSGIESCMSGGFARLLILFNPRGKFGHVFNIEEQHKAKVIHLSAFRHPNVIVGKDLIPGAVSRETVVRRINEWTRPLISGEEPKKSEIVETPEYLEGAIAKSLEGIDYPPLPRGKRVVMDNAFFYMVMGVYPDQNEDQLISPEWLEAARIRWDDYVARHGEVPPVPQGRFGLDVAEYGGDFNVPLFRYGDYVERVEKIWQGVDPIVTGDKAVEIIERKNPEITLVDGTGAGSGVAPYIARKRKGTLAYSIKVAGKPSPMIQTEIGEFYQLRDQIWWACREWLRTQNAMLPPDPMLLEELRVPTYRVTNGKIHIMDKDTMREKLKRSPNFADALILTFVPANKARVISLSGARYRDSEGKGR